MIFRQLFLQWKAYLVYGRGYMMEENHQDICQMGEVAIIEIMMLIIANSMLRELRPFPKMLKVSNSL